MDCGHGSVCRDGCPCAGSWNRNIIGSKIGPLLAVGRLSQTSQDVGSVPTVYSCVALPYGYDRILTLILYNNTLL
jgi:hypothetical protein